MSTKKNFIIGGSRWGALLMVLQNFKNVDNIRLFVQQVGPWKYVITAKHKPFPILKKLNAVIVQLCSAVHV